MRGTLFTPLPFSAILNDSIFYLVALPNLAIVELIRLEKLLPTPTVTTYVRSLSYLDIPVQLDTFNARIKTQCHVLCVSGEWW